MKILGIICFIGISIGIIALAVYLTISKSHLLKLFENGNVITFGKKRKGKDLLNCFVANNQKKSRGIFGNISYNKRTHVISHCLLDVFPNNQFDLIDGKYHIIDKPLMLGLYYKSDYFISDAGIMFPSDMDYKLHQKCPYMPIAYALSGQLWGMNIHCNTQALDRLWKPLREQADNYVKALWTINIFGFLITKYRSYDKYSSALQDVRPFKAVGIGNEYSKAMVSIERSKYGEIKEGIIIQHKSTLKYDTRVFHQYFYGTKAPSKKDFRLKRKYLKKIKSN